MLSIENNARLRRYPVSNWVFDLKDCITGTAFKKRKLILELLQQSNIKLFVESGTYLGDTSAYLAKHDYTIITIELEPRLALYARQRFKNKNNIETIEGNSTDILPGVLNRLDEPALFFLDGHYSGSGTAPGNSPVKTETDLIRTKAKAGSIVVIDDAHMFNGKNGYPEKTEFINLGAMEVFNMMIFRIT